jgi:hypothetical protein|tara:strand:+ start:931 stop:1104 length:174 start_codon:yes stop_codon:yes gene_type:complete
MVNHVRRLGTEKKSDVDEDFDKYYDIYKQKAEEQGYNGEIKVLKERGKIIFYVELDY